MRTGGSQTHAAGPTSRPGPARTGPRGFGWDFARGFENQADDADGGFTAKDIPRDGSGLGLSDAESDLAFVWDASGAGDPGDSACDGGARDSRLRLPGDADLATW